MTAGRRGTSHPHGTVHWAVPAGAEFDLDVDNSYLLQVIAWQRLHRQQSNDLWANRWPDDHTHLSDFGITSQYGTDAVPVHWDEVEDWDDRIPMRPSLTYHRGEFSDLCDTHRVPAHFYGPMDAELRQIEKDEAVIADREAKARARLISKQQLEVKRAAKRAVRERKAAAKAREQARRKPVVTVPPTMKLKDLFG